MTAMFSAVTGTKPTLTAQLIAATERADDLLTLCREQRRLAHRVRLARLRAELIGLHAEEQDALTEEVAEWKRLVRAFAQSRRAA